MKEFGCANFFFGQKNHTKKKIKAGKMTQEVNCALPANFTLLLHLKSDVLQDISQRESRAKQHMLQ